MKCVCGQSILSCQCNNKTAQQTFYNFIGEFITPHKSICAELRDCCLIGIAEKSPLAVTGTKAVLLRSRELTVEQGLDYVATWNSGMLLSDDLKEAMSSNIQKRKPVFAKL